LNEVGPPSTVSNIINLERDADRTLYSSHTMQLTLFSVVVLEHGIIDLGKLVQMPCPMDVAVTRHENNGTQLWSRPSVTNPYKWRGK
jgi:hypothetical protein